VNEVVVTSFRFAFLAAAVLAFAPLKTGAADAGEIKTVLELYTSQGCSSCPPADALFEDYVKRPDVLALTMPVDYWDYLGWKDTFAKRAFSTRQRLYAKQRGDGQVYTPQVVVNGLDHAVGSRKPQIEAAIVRTRKKLADRRIAASLEVQGDDLLITATESGAARNAPVKCRVWLAHIQKVGKVHIGRGENGGRDLRYYNVVRQMSPVGTWMGKDMTIRLPAKSAGAAKTDSYAVIFQVGMAGPIVGAAELKRP